MLFLENIQLALEGLKTNKMRALLTMLGIIIGIGSVIGIVTVGNSMTASVSSSMQSLGASNIMVMIQEREASLGPGGGMQTSSTMAESDLITDEMIEEYTNMYSEHIEAVSMSSSGGSGQAQDGRLYANVTVTGVNDGYGTANNVELLNGRFIRDSDVKTNRYVAVVSDRLVENMFPKNFDPLGQEVKIYMDDSIQTFTIVGVYKHEQDMMMAMMGASVADKDIRSNMYIPISTCDIITGADKGYQYITIMGTGKSDAQKLSDDTGDFFNTYYTNNTKFHVTTINMESMMNQMTSMMSTLSLAIAVIAGISLIVGGVGVMNIMLVSVTERTREIGTRKALGARSSAIRVQFVVEAVIICAIGGVIGILVGIGLGYLMSSIMGFPGFPSISIIIIAVFFSMMIGVFFGYYPANKAAKLDPIEALRYE